MKNFKFLMIGVLFMGMAGLSSCDKEANIEENLWEGNGMWNIDVWESEGTSTFFEEDVYIDQKTNAGTMKFNKDGTGVYYFSAYSDTYAITYTNTDNKLTIVLKDEDGNIEDDEAQVFDLDWRKDHMRLYSFTTETYSTGDGNGGTVLVTATHRLDLTLSKM